MTLLTTLGIAFGLAMDVFAVSISSGMNVKQIRFTQALKIAASFGIFQSAMPVFGWLAGTQLRTLIQEADHWVAFGLLACIGGKMIYEGLKHDSIRKPLNPLDTNILFMLAVATSIDALAVGIGFAILGIFILKPIIIIGSVSFLMSMIGIRLGDRFGAFFGKKVEIIGGLVLIGIGSKILIEHLI